MQRIRDLDIEHDDDFERVDARVRVTLWTLVTMFLLAAAAGFTGSGPLSKVRVRSGPVEADYSRVLRQYAAAEFKLRVDGASAWVSRDYVAWFSLEEINPEPSSVHVENGRLRLDFHEPPGVVTARLKPVRAGIAYGAAGTGRGQIEIRQIILP